jgi:hypothetical protein
MDSQTPVASSPKASAHAAFNMACVGFRGTKIMSLCPVTAGSSLVCEYIFDSYNPRHYADDDLSAVLRVRRAY